jgi:hypothetical protein
MILKKESINDYTFFLDIPASEIHQRSSTIRIGVYQDNKKVQTVKSKFLGPF